jgi:hypothetical protein
MNPEDVVVFGATIMSILLFVMGAISLLRQWATRESTAAAVRKAAVIAQATNEDVGTLKEQAAGTTGADFKSAWEGIAALAVAIEKLEISSRLFVLSLSFLAVAAVIVGVQDVTAAVEVATSG